VVPRDRHEHLVERRPAQPDPRQRHPGIGQAAHQDSEKRGGVVPHRHDDPPGDLVDRRRSLRAALDDGDRPPHRLGASHHDLDGVAADSGLELVRRATGYDRAVVDDDQVVAELVGLLQVLGGEDDRGSLPHQVAHRPPHPDPAGRIEPGRRLVQKEDRRSVGHAGSQVEPPAHAPRVGPDRAVRRVLELELPEQLVGTAASGSRGDVVQPQHQTEVLAPGQMLVDACVLARQTDDTAHVGGIAHHVEPVDGGSTPVRHRQGRQHPDRGGLAGAVRSEHAQHRAAARVEGHVPHRHRATERLAQPVHRDGHVPRQGHTFPR
jgi:hypothetical protein